MFFADTLRRCTLSIVLVFSTLCANAVPAKPGLIRRISLADGTSISARLVGDEFGHYWLGDDGQAYIDQQGKDIFALADIKAINNKAKAQRAQANQLRTRRAAPRKANQVNQANQVKGYFGKKKGVIILTEFSALSFKAGNDSVLFDRIANEIGYSEGKFIGSMRDYFYDQSKGKFELDFDVVGPVKLSKNYSYYGKNNSSGDDMHPAEMVSEACQLADSLVNFKDYDWDGDGEVDQVLVLFAGKGEADGGASNTVWPHEWQLSSAGYYGDGTGALKLDGVKIDTYACVSELDGSTGKVAGIGTMCHEFSHCLGFPDFYDTDYSGGQGMGYWDLMDNGSYNGNGYVPAGYTSYERWEAGWKEPIELKTDTIVTGMMPLQDDGETYIIYNDGHKNEYFLLENREPTGWDIHLPGKGLLILQVDYNAMAWQSNTPNDTPNHQRMTWIPADNKFQYTTYLGTKYYSEAGMANDPFPYGQVDAFSKWTQPEAKFYNKTANGTNYMDFSVKGIKRNADMTIDFTFKATRSIANPTFSIEGGVYHEAQTVAIECSTEGAEIYYTTNGSAPTTSSSSTTSGSTIPCTLPITVNAMAVATNYDNSTVTTTVLTQGMSGDGTAENPYTIKYQGDLDDFITKANTADGASKHYKVTATTTLDFSRVATITQPFTGSFDGNYLTMTGLSHALFNTINNGTVKNVILKDIDIQSGDSDGDAGAICNKATGNSRIYNCGVLGTLTETKDDYGNVTNIESTSTISGSGNVGSIVGLLDGTSRVINCYSFANVSGGTMAAGIVGNNAQASTQSSLKTIVVNCMFYGDISGDGSKYPVYGNNSINNDSDTGINPYCYFRKNATFTPTAYNRSWPAEEKNLTRFEYYRSVLNSNRKLCTWWVNGANGTAPTDNDVTDVGIAKWVLDPSIAPYPILKEWGKYPSIINQDPDKRVDPSTKTWEKRDNASANWGKDMAPETEGQILGSVSVTINAGSHHSGTKYLTGSTSKPINITAMDTEYNDYCYGKIQLSYYNEIFG